MFSVFVLSVDVPSSRKTEGIQHPLESTLCRLVKNRGYISDGWIIHAASGAFLTERKASVFWSRNTKGCFLYCQWGLVLGYRRKEGLMLTSSCSLVSWKWRFHSIKGHFQYVLGKTDISTKLYLNWNVGHTNIGLPSRWAPLVSSVKSKSEWNFFIWRP